MADQTDDRLTLDQQIGVAHNARVGGFFSRRRFRQVFSPGRVHALLVHVERAGIALAEQEAVWRSRDRALTGQVQRVRDLIAKWRAEGDDLAAKELEEALAPPKGAAPQEDAASDNL